MAVRDGQRRTLAARQAGLAAIPVYVLSTAGAALDAKTADAERIAQQIVTNDQRTALTDAQRAKGINQMLLAGISAGRSPGFSGLRPVGLANELCECGWRPPVALSSERLAIQQPGHLPVGCYTVRRRQPRDGAGGRIDQFVSVRFGWMRYCVMPCPPACFACAPWIISIIHAKLRPIRYHVVLQRLSSRVRQSSVVGSVIVSTDFRRYPRRARPSGQSTAVLRRRCRRA